MADKVLRGSRLGSLSYESDTAVALAPSARPEFHCPEGHVFNIRFATEALGDEGLPAQWECRTCGRMALRVDAVQPEPVKKKHQRTHWDMLLERRTRAELEELLQERLELLRARRGETKPAKSSAKTA